MAQPPSRSWPRRRGGSRSPGSSPGSPPPSPAEPTTHAIGTGATNERATDLCAGRARHRRRRLADHARPVGRRDATQLQHAPGRPRSDAPQASFSRIVTLACAAAEGVTDLDATVHCSFGDYPVREYFWQINVFRALRAHDIARIIGVDPLLSFELVQGVYDEVFPNIDEWRSIGVFPAPRPVPDDAPLLDRLLAMTGRDPDAA